MDITLGEDGGDDSGVVRSGVFVDVEIGEVFLIGTVLFVKLGDKTCLISGDCECWGEEE